MPTHPAPLTALQLAFTAGMLLAAALLFGWLLTPADLSPAGLAATAVMTAVVLASDLRSRRGLAADRVQLSFSGVYTIAALPFAGYAPVAIANVISQLLDKRQGSLPRVLSAAHFVISLGIAWLIWQWTGGPAGVPHWPGGGARVPDFLWQLALADLAFTVGGQFWVQVINRVLRPQHPFRRPLWGAMGEFVVRLLVPAFVDPFLVEAALVLLLALGPWWAAIPLVAYTWRMTNVAMGEVDAEFRRRQLALAEERAATDGLTGVRNRMFLDTELDRRLAGQAPWCMVMLDLDEFKIFNDVHGHLAGDALLRQVAAALHEHVRRTDIIARYGGDEFVLVLDGTAEDLLPRLHDLWPAVAAATGVTLSGGLVFHPGPYRERTPLLAAADRLLYEAKRQGRNRLLAEPPVQG